MDSIGFMTYLSYYIDLGLFYQNIYDDFMPQIQINGRS